MDNYRDYQMEEETIDLMELLFYVLRKWRVLLLAGIIGVVLGAGVGLLKPEKTIEDLDMDEIHIKEIGQYARYQQLYDEQLRKESESIYMNMDPEKVYKGEKIYYITAYDSDMSRINEMYNSIFRSERIYYDLMDASGLECTETAIHELAWISFSKYELEEKEIYFGKRERNAKVSITTVAPTEEACRGMLNLLDERVQAINRLMERTYPKAKYELISDSCNVGYDSRVMSERSESASLLATYVTEMSTLKKNLTDDDLLYYSEVYGVEEEEEEEGDLGWLKWSIIIGVLFGGMMVVFYGVLFLMDGRVKNIDELKLRYGLHLIACLEGEKKSKKLCTIDRMLMSKLQYNSDEYLQAAFESVNAKAIHVCGDMANAEIASRMKLIAEKNGVTLSNRLSVDEKAQQLTKESDGIVLYVQLWNTKHADLIREIEIANYINARVLGVVVID